jgi:hypothetical protein
MGKEKALTPAHQPAMGINKPGFFDSSGNRSKST